jgi:hypothetical protein
MVILTVIMYTKMLYRKNRKNTRRNSRRNRRNTRRNNINMMGGASGMPSPVGDASMKGPMGMSLAQGQQFADYHKNQHGGFLSGGPYPGVITEESLIPANMAASARTAPLNAALNEIKGMSDQAGGKRRRRNSMRKRKNNTMSMRKRKNNTMSMRKRKNNTMSMRKRKNNNMSMRKRKNNTMSMRKRKNNNMSMRKRNYNMMGGAVFSPALTSSPSLLLPSGLEAKAVSGMNAEWKLAENPRSFAPGL